MLLFLSVAACERGTGDRTAGGGDSSATTSIRRVAAVGDSITWGSGLTHRERDSYPAQLGRMLGDQHEVGNFGVNGTTLLRKGDRPYRTTSAFDAAQAFTPDVVVIMLGTNDAKPPNWRYREAFVADYVAMIDAFAALPSRPAIWVCHPVPTFGAYGARDPVLRNDVIPMIDRVAKARRVPAIDLYAALRGRVDLFPNGIHPNAEGARLIAETVRRAIRTPRPRGALGPRGRQPQSLPVDHVAWLGAGAVTLDGVRIAQDAAIGARAVVTGDINPFAIAAGALARVIRDRRGVESGR